jgi:hypothetical protein
MIRCRFEAGMAGKDWSQPAPTLLDDMREFMTEKAAAGACSRLVFPAPEHDMPTDRVRAGRQGRG